MNPTKEQLLNQIRQIEDQEKQEQQEKAKAENYQKFLNRNEDWVVGKAHCDIEQSKDSYGWGRNTHSIGQAISISGNCGKSYKPEASITNATYTFFHNVWTHRQQQQFQNALNKVAYKEIKKIMGNLRSVLEIMGLQSTSYFLRELYPANKIKEIQDEIWKETVKVLDQYTDKDFRQFAKENTHTWYSEGGETSKEIDLSHSKNILKRYVTEHRPKLSKLFSF